MAHRTDVTVYSFLCTLMIVIANFLNGNGGIEVAWATRNEGPMLSKSKLSIHTGMGTNSWAVINGAHPRLIKLLDNFDQAAAIKEAVPGIVIVGRIYLASQPTDGDPSAAAAAWFNANNATIAAHPAVDFWEGYNEPGVSNIEDIEWYAAMEAERVRLLAAEGVRASIGQFATGNPDCTNSTVLEAFNPAIDAAMRHDGIMGLHEYSSPLLSGCFSGSPQNGSGWMTGRYRKWYESVLIPQGRSIPLVISEVGIDNSPCNSPNLGGWINYCSSWGSSDCAAEYIKQLAWYDSVLRFDDYVIGATVYQLDIPSWADYSLAYKNAYEKLVAYMNSV